MARFHPPEDMVIDHAVGTLAEAQSLFVASHVSLCPDCRVLVREVEEAGGLLLHAIDPVPVDQRLREAVLSNLHHVDENDWHEARFIADTATLRAVPEPLRSHMAVNLHEIPWQRVTSKLARYDLPNRDPRFVVRMLKIAAGSRMPKHEHGGMELTMVLAGAFTDDRGRYGRGDVALGDPSIRHSPIAEDGEDCLCLTVVEGGLSLSGPIGKVVNLFYKF